MQLKSVKRGHNDDKIPVTFNFFFLYSKQKETEKGQKGHGRSKTPQERIWFQNKKGQQSNSALKIHKVGEKLCRIFNDFDFD